MVETFIVTGAHGYIGSHICVELMEIGFNVIGIDSDSRSNPSAVEKLHAYENYRSLSIDLSQSFSLPLELVGLEVSVIHCAGFKDVVESLKKPFLYFENNLTATINLIDALKGYRLKDFVFSSTAAVYDPAAMLPLWENSRIAPKHPYGKSKLCAELVIESVVPCVFPQARIWILRYFNPVGCSEWWVPNLNADECRSLQDQLAWCVTTGATLQIFRSTGASESCVRDFLSITELIQCHIQCCLQKDISLVESPVYLNVGTGRGIAVHELISEISKDIQLGLKWEFADHRAGEVSASYGGVKKLKNLFGWTPRSNLVGLSQDIIGYARQAKVPLNSGSGSK